jgi:AraC-like DNA-binding protein
MYFDSIKKIPSSKTLQQYIEYYWIVDNFTEFDKYPIMLNSYPGTAPELFIPLHGYSEHFYLGNAVQNEKPTFYGFIYNKLTSNISNHARFVLVTFKSLGLASVQPFSKYSTKEILKAPVIGGDKIFGNSILKLQEKLKEVSTDDIAHELDAWFTKLFQQNKKGFINEISRLINIDFSVQELIKITNTSYSTLERYFKKETGFTPKQFYIFKRFSAITNGIIKSGNKNWYDHILDYYYDQSHFIKEVKKYSGHTPTELLELPSLVHLRPDISFMTNFYNEI